MSVHVSYYRGYTDGVQAAAQQIVAIIVLANPDIIPTAWQTSLLAWGVLACAIFANTIMFRKLPLIEGVIMIIHVSGFFAVVIVLWYIIK